jgi:hypothetical protein
MVNFHNYLAVGNNFGWIEGTVGGGNYRAFGSSNFLIEL